MPIINLFSKRMAEERDGATDVYTYDRFSDNFRVQLSLMIQEILGMYTLPIVRLSREMFTRLS